MHSFVGTRLYMAPEILSDDLKNDGYDKHCDMWSLGIIAYYLLTGHNPLPPPVVRAPISEMKITEVLYPEGFWKDLSANAKDFVQQLLQIDPSKRLSGRIWIE